MPPVGRARPTHSYMVFAFDASRGRRISQQGTEIARFSGQRRSPAKSEAPCRRRSFAPGSDLRRALYTPGSRIETRPKKTGFGVPQQCLRASDQPGLRSFEGGFGLGERNYATNCVDERPKRALLICWLQLTVVTRILNGF